MIRLLYDNRVAAVSAACTPVPHCAKPQKTESRRETFAVVDAKPKVRLDARTFDFGEVNQGELVEHAFEIFNDGKRRPRAPIEEVRSSCDCLIAAVGAN